MSNSSAQSVYSITSSDTITISDTFTLTGGDTIYTGAGISAFGSGDTITIGNGGAGTYVIGGGITSSSTINTNTINSGAGAGFNWKTPEEFVDAFPDYDRIQKMCKEYPGLKIAYEKFVTTYKLVKDHYDTPEDQRPKP